MLKFKLLVVASYFDWRLLIERKTSLVQWSRIDKTSETYQTVHGNRKLSLLKFWLAILKYPEIKAYIFLVALIQCNQSCLPVLILDRATPNKNKLDKGSMQKTII